MGVIPKIIHYFSDNEPIFVNNPKTFLRICYMSWKRFCPDYEIILWHDGLPEFQEMLKHSKYLRECYKLKLWAYVSDYVRMYALNKYGGIWLDTDVQLLKSLDEFLNDKFFISAYSENHKLAGMCEPAVMGGEKNHPVFQKMLNLYDDDEFLQSEMKLQNYIEFNIVPTLSRIMSGFRGGGQLSCSLNNDFKDTLENCDIKIYPQEYFLPDWHNGGATAITDKTAAIHWENNSWSKGQVIIKKKKLSITGFSPLRKLYHQSKIFRYELITRIKTTLHILTGKSLQ